jgi:hypothetical protein
MLTRNRVGVNNAPRRRQGLARVVSDQRLPECPQEPRSLASFGSEFGVVGRVDPAMHKIAQATHVDATELQPLDLAVDATGVWVLNRAISRLWRISS